MAVNKTGYGATKNNKKAYLMFFEIGFSIRKSAYVSNWWILNICVNYNLHADFYKISDTFQNRNGVLASRYSRISLIRQIQLRFV